MKDMKFFISESFDGCFFAKMHKKGSSFADPAICSSRKSEVTAKEERRKSEGTGRYLGQPSVFTYDPLQA